MTDAKHEAPAEEAGEREALAAIMHRNMIPDEDGGFSFHDLKAADQIMDYLRARSSAPEAREEALGNLLAVIHGDGGHRALEVGTKQAALEAEQIVAGLFAAPSADKLRTAVEAIWEIAGGRAAEGHNETGRLARIKDRASEALDAMKAEGV